MGFCHSQRYAFSMNNQPSLLRLLVLLLSMLSLVSQAADPVALFDGKTLNGWEGTEGIWRVEDGAITAGSHTKKFPRNEFISTKKNYANFDLRLTIKCSGDLATGQGNSGIQVRSARLPGGPSVAGYQVDCGNLLAVSKRPWQR